MRSADLPVTVNGHRITGHIVLDIGANEPMIHQRLVDKFKYAVNPNGIHGESLMMARTIEPLELTLFPDDCDREAQALDTMMVMSGDSLPDVLLDNEIMAQLAIVVDTVNMTASYRAKPYDFSDSTLVFYDVFWRACDWYTNRAHNLHVRTNACARTGARRFKDY